MSFQRFCVVMTTWLMVTGIAWGRGGSMRPAAQHSTPQPRPVQMYSASGSVSHNNTIHGRDHRFFDRNAVLVYPWWYAYGDNPYDSSTYTSESSTNSTAVDTSNSPATVPFDPNGVRETMDSIASRAAVELYASALWKQATVELNQAAAGVAAANDRVARSLNSQPQYRAAMAEKQEAEQLAASLHERGASVEEVWPVALHDLQASQTITRIRNEALAGEPDVLEARARLQAAVAARRSLQEGLRTQIMSDPKWRQARVELGEDW